MATSEIKKSNKEKKPKTTSPPSSSAPMSTHGYVSSSQQPHPYMWGPQHIMMPPYGNQPHPHVTMYPPGGMYAQTSMPPGSYSYIPYAMPCPNGITEAYGNTEGDSKQSVVKEELPIKRMRGSLKSFGNLNVITGKNNGKNLGVLANRAYSKRFLERFGYSGETPSDGSSEGSDVNSQNDSVSGQDKKDGGSANSRQNGSVGGTAHLPMSQTVPMTPAGVPVPPPTNLNIGMEYYLPGGMYAHPSMPPGSYSYSPYAMPFPNEMTEASGNAKQSDVKEKLPIKRIRGSLGSLEGLGSLNVIRGKNNEPRINLGVSANGAKSGESPSGGSSEGSDDTNSQNDLGSVKDENEAYENGGGLPPVTMTTSLNMGMEYWGGPPLTSTAIPGMYRNAFTALPGVVTPVSRNGGRSQPWTQDARELKREKRKQSNRESATRSRLRKQVECDVLAQRAEALNDENKTLREEINKFKSRCEEFKSRCEELTAENTSLKDQLLSFPPLEGIKIEKEDQEPDTIQIRDVKKEVD